jgi:hypothetical protein
MCSVHAHLDPFGPFPVYVPREPSRVLTDVPFGAAIVGFPTEADPTLIRVFYEANLYDSPDLLRFADRVKHAAGHCRFARLDLEEWRFEHADRPPPSAEYGYVAYPTSAQTVVPAADLIEVATYDDVLGVVRAHSPEAAEHLADWIAGEAPAELLATGRAFEARRREACDGRDVAN